MRCPMKTAFRLLVAAAMMTLSVTAARADDQPRSACVTCHSQQEDESLSAPPKAFLGDVHEGRGISCHDCHGGNPGAAVDDEDAAHDEDDFAFIGAPDPTAIPELCGRCHSDLDYMRTYNPRARVDQLTEYRTSHHGKRLAEDDESVATCVSCHGAHGVLLVKDPRSPVYPTQLADTCARCHADQKLMAPRGVPTDQREKWGQSAHGMAVARGDLAAPTCNGCHGNHGAAPPEIAAVANACGHCHTREAVLFAASPLSEPWKRLGLPECVKCHSNHLVMSPSDAMVGNTGEAVCQGCHEQHGERGAGVAAAVRKSYDELAAAIQVSKEGLDRAESQGMEVGEDRYQLSQAHDHLVEARVLIHSFDKEKIQAKVAEGSVVAAAVKEAGEEAMRQLAVRRRGLAIALVIILAAIVGLWLKLRFIEAEQARQA